MVLDTTFPWNLQVFPARFPAFPQLSKSPVHHVSSSCDDKQGGVPWFAAQVTEHPRSPAAH